MTARQSPAIHSQIDSQKGKEARAIERQSGSQKGKAEIAK
jgi:hypothetical protein